MKANNTKELRHIMTQLKDLCLQMEGRDEAQLLMALFCGIKNVRLQMQGIAIYKEWGIEFEEPQSSFTFEERMSEIEAAKLAVYNKFNNYKTKLQNND
jgi:hypothetical protein